MEDKKREKVKFKDLLLSISELNDRQIKEVFQLQKSSGKKLEEILIKKGYITEEALIEVLELQLGISCLDLDKFYIDPETTMLITENMAKKYTLIPIKKENNKIKVAMADPLNIFAIDDVEIYTGLKVEPVISTRKQISYYIDQYYDKQNAEKAIEDFEKQYDIDEKKIEEELTTDVDNAPVVRLVNAIIRQAVKSRASDIHIEPLEKEVRVRFRIDGELQEIMRPAKSTHSAIVTRIKIMGKMDIAEKRIPQDGRVEAEVDNKYIDLRISILPTVFGEKIVLRLLDRTSALIFKKDLGFTKDNLKKFNNIIKTPNGMIIVTGPTGSGKTTTLYTILTELNTINKNIITVEDPVEYRLNGINQVQVNTKTGLTFANGLRSILRQDPDVIMIGEIRDIETAQIAVRASITGHLVITTMHTNDAPTTITRLLNMGVAPYMVSSSLVAVLAQRLVKKICKNCKEKYYASKYEMKLLDIDDSAVLYKGKGCPQCYYTGYKGRIAIHEIMPITNNIKDIIDIGKSVTDLRKEAIAQGMVSLYENCRELVLNGTTTIDEMNRVTYNME
ncbi:GspE/PulE family protein [Clostridiisalibacter paucivorans]|uniref:GspE/PulE family protein n=1 Tax=Clostridiisalibacter paucivorans TaxID=408753 RepID=UPI00047A86BD|nr:GspE/PulE family protein [Clostridiisalibacter paucivorans]